MAACPHRRRLAYRNTRRTTPRPRSGRRTRNCGTGGTIEHPGEGITREQAVEAYTRGSAFAEFAETEKGTLTAGKLADLAVLSQDIFKVAPPELPKTLSVLTLV